MILIFFASFPQISKAMVYSKIFAGGKALSCPFRRNFLSRCHSKTQIPRANQVVVCGGQPKKFLLMNIIPMRKPIFLLLIKYVTCVMHARKMLTVFSNLLKNNNKL